jgi:hypothetical protein
MLQITLYGIIYCGNDITGDASMTDALDSHTAAPAGNAEV